MTEFARQFAEQHRPPLVDPEKAKGARKARTPMPRVSKRMAKIKRETDGPREEFVEAAGECMVEGCPNPPQHRPHEITCGNGREAALYQPRMQMAVCTEHHTAFHNDLGWTKERQLTERAWWELNQMRKEFCENRGVAPSDFTMEEMIIRLTYRKPVKKKRAKRGKCKNTKAVSPARTAKSEAIEVATTT